MKPGRELDALIAEKIMGWEFHNAYAGERYLFPPHLIEFVQSSISMKSGLMEFVPPAPPYYSTDIKDAWKVIEEMESRKFILRLQSPAYMSYRWTALFQNKCISDDDFIDRANSFHFNTAPLAICNAALMALGEYRE